ncbi:hypothetical protein [Rodentibacter caecimuris]|uniref:hypothetical protein n=1 Tax=Rodentibacter caecimuris TaxID=1796644 RepID=UPI0015C2E2CC
MILDSWLVALQQEGLKYQAVGNCTDILYLMDIPHKDKCFIVMKGERNYSTVNTRIS